MGESIYEIIVTIIIIASLGSWSFIVFWLGYISGNTKGFSDGYDNSIKTIDELEKVKEKIFNKQDEFIHSNLLSECNVRYGLEIAEVIIDKEIAELKGE